MGTPIEDAVARGGMNLMKPQLFKDQLLSVVPKDKRGTQLAWAIEWYMKTDWEVGICQRSVSRGRVSITFDLFGFGDLFAFRWDEHLIIQATSANNHADRFKKICNSALAKKWNGASEMNFIHVISQNTRAKGVKVAKGQIRLSQLMAGDFIC